MCNALTSDHVREPTMPLPIRRNRVLQRSNPVPATKPHKTTIAALTGGVVVCDEHNQIRTLATSSASGPCSPCW